MRFANDLCCVPVIFLFCSLQIWSHLLKKSLIENFIFCAVIIAKSGGQNPTNMARSESRIDFRTQCVKMMRRR